MPAGVDETRWSKARELARERGRDEDWPYVMGIYRRLSGGGGGGVGKTSDESPLWDRLGKVAAEPVGELGGLAAYGIDTTRFKPTYKEPGWLGRLAGRSRKLTGVELPARYARPYTPNDLARFKQLFPGATIKASPAALVASEYKDAPTFVKAVDDANRYRRDNPELFDQKTTGLLSRYSTEHLSDRVPIVLSKKLPPHVAGMASSTTSRRYPQGHRALKIEVAPTDPAEKWANYEVPAHEGRHMLEPSRVPGGLPWHRRPREHAAEFGRYVAALRNQGAEITPELLAQYLDHTRETRRFSEDGTTWTSHFVPRVDSGTAPEGETSYGYQYGTPFSNLELFYPLEGEDQHRQQEIDLSKRGPGFVDASPARPGVPRTSAESDESPLRRLVELKASSDRRDYGGKAAMFRALVAERPDEFEPDSLSKGMYGVTHVPTGFRFHIPREAAPAAWADDALWERIGKVAEDGAVVGKRALARWRTDDNLRMLGGGTRPVGDDYDGTTSRINALRNAQTRLHLPTTAGDGPRRMVDGLPTANINPRRDMHPTPGIIWRGHGAINDRMSTFGSNMTHASPHLNVAKGYATNPSRRETTGLGFVTAYRTTPAQRYYPDFGLEKVRAGSVYKTRADIAQARAAFRTNLQGSPALDEKSLRSLYDAAYETNVTPQNKKLATYVVESGGRLKTIPTGAEKKVMPLSREMMRTIKTAPGAVQTEDQMTGLVRHNQYAQQQEQLRAAYPTSQARWQLRQQNPQLYNQVAAASPRTRGSWARMPSAAQAVKASATSNAKAALDAGKEVSGYNTVKSIPFWARQAAMQGRVWADQGRELAGRAAPYAAAAATGLKSLGASAASVAAAPAVAIPATAAVAGAAGYGLGRISAGGGTNVHGRLAQAMVPSASQQELGTRAALEAWQRGGTVRQRFGNDMGKYLQWQARRDQRPPQQGAR